MFENITLVICVALALLLIVAPLIVRTLGLPLPGDGEDVENEAEPVAPQTFYRAGDSCPRCEKNVLQITTVETDLEFIGGGTLSVNRVSCPICGIIAEQPLN